MASVPPGHTIRVRVGCEFDYESEWPVPMLMLVRARPDAEHRLVHEARFVEPDVAIHEYTDHFGNRCWRVLAPGGPIRIRYDALVDVSADPDPIHHDAPLTAVHKLPDDAMVFTLPSRYVESDLLLDAAWQLFGGTPPTWARVQAICDWVHTNIRYETGSSDPATTAFHVYNSRVGVCRDFALIAVALCRAVNIPARYVFGYLPDIAIEPPDVAMDFHAWFEAYLGERWHTFDARHNEPRIGRIVIGRGRDAVDVSLTTSYGLLKLNRMTVWSDEENALGSGQEFEDIVRRRAIEITQSDWGGSPPIGWVQGLPVP